MRVVKSLPDVQKVLNELLDFKQRIETGNIDLNGRRIINAGESKNASDYVTKGELKTYTAVLPNDDQFYTVPFSSTGAVNDGDLAAPFVVHNGREGYPYIVWVAATQAPTTDAKFNISINGNDLLAQDITLPATSTGPISSANFVIPTPKIGNLTKINPIIRIGGGAALVSIGLVVKVITRSKNG